MTEQASDPESPVPSSEKRVTLDDQAVAAARATVTDAADTARATVVDAASGDRTTLDDVAGPGRDTAGGAASKGEADRATAADAEGEAAPQASAEAAEAPPKKSPRATIYVVVGGLLFIALAGPLVAYFLLLRYQPTAVKHVPAGTNMAVRIDAKELYLYKPFRDHVLSVLDDAPGVKSRGDRLNKLTGIDLRADVREIVVASPDGKRFVVLVGGYFHEARFNHADVVKGLKKFLEEEGVAGISEKGGVLFAPGGIELTQADDSTLVIANDDDLLKASLHASDEWTNLGLAGTGAMSFTLATSALDHLHASLSTFDDAAVFAHADRISGSLRLGASPELAIELLPRKVTPEALSKETETALADVKLWDMFLPDEAGEHELLASAKTKPRASSVMVTATWPTSGLETLMKRVGQAAEGILGKKTP